MFSLIFDIEGEKVECTYTNTEILRFRNSERFGKWSVCNCIILKDRGSLIFESEDEQLILQDYGWEAPIDDYPPTEIIDTFYLNLGLDPASRN